VHRSTPDHEPYLTADQLAPLLGVSLDWVYERAKAGDLPSYVLPGGRRRFLYSDVRKAMESWRSGPPPSPRLGTA
jgi:excisionase family DNA binding protein